MIITSADGNKLWVVSTGSAYAPPRGTAFFDICKRSTPIAPPTRGGLLGEVDAEGDAEVGVARREGGAADQRMVDVPIEEGT